MDLTNLTTLDLTLVRITMLIKENPAICIQGIANALNMNIYEVEEWLRKLSSPSGNELE